jgi:hypothetical protein
MLNWWHLDVVDALHVLGHRSVRLGRHVNAKSGAATRVASSTTDCSGG